MRSMIWIGVGAGAMMSACTAPQATVDAGRDAVSEARSAAVHYRSWERLTGSLQWAPTWCREPPTPSPRFSGSPNGTIHGRKLFHLYASDEEAYKAVIDDRDEGGALVLVKEVRLPIVLPESGDFTSLQRHDAAGIAVSPEDGRRYTPGRVAALFIMLREADAGEETDNGWSYAVVDPDGNRAIEAGLIESCVRCHSRAPHGRVFGLPR